jgi:hypothetical protein
MFSSGLALLVLHFRHTNAARGMGVLARCLRFLLGLSIFEGYGVTGLFVKSIIGRHSYIIFLSLPISGLVSFCLSVLAGGGAF